jgi:hypothetical protein
VEPRELLRFGCCFDDCGFVATLLLISMELVFLVVFDGELGEKKH